MTDSQGPWSRPPAPPPPRASWPRIGLFLIFASALGALIFALARAFPEALQSGDDWTDLAYKAGVVVLVAAGLSRIRPGAVGAHLKHVAIWTGVVAVLALGYAYREEMAGVPQHLAIAFSAGDPVVTGEHELVCRRTRRAPSRWSAGSTASG